MSTERRYDIDWLRVIAIGLLLVYHTSIAFQSWGIMLGFITNDRSIASLWIPMAMLNVWRIPILFFISGMGIYFACQNRNRKQLLQERAKRILVPFIFAVFFVVPVQLFIVQHYYHQSLNYIPNPAHVWFLGNIFIYVLLLLPFFMYIKRNDKGRSITRLKKLIVSPVSLLIVVVAFIIEALLVNPAIYELYAMTWHGFFLGLLAFFFGFCFALGGPSFSKMLSDLQWLFLIIAILLYTFRVLQVQMKVSNIQLVIESGCWIFSVFGFAYKYLNRSGKILRYLIAAAYPVYILHMIFLYLGSMLIFPLNIEVHLKFIFVLLFTVAGCFALYELVIRRISFISILFGLKSRPVIDKKAIP